MLNQGSEQSLGSSITERAEQARNVLKKFGFTRWLMLMGRTIFVLGPARQLFSLHCKNKNLNPLLPRNTENLIGNIDEAETIRCLNENGFSGILSLNDDIVCKLQEEFRYESGLCFSNPHLSSHTVQKIAHNRKILEVVKGYIGCEPRILSSMAYWLTGEEYNSADIHDTAGEVRLNQVPYHYDTIDFRSVTVFVYLSDVGIDNAPHAVILGTHREGIISRLLNNPVQNKLDVNKAERRYPGYNRVILGRAGSLFLEDTSNYHKANECKTRRLMLKIDYVLQRTIMKGKIYGS